MLRHIRIPLLTAALAFGGMQYVFAADSATEKFLGEAIQGSRAEVQVSRLALEKAQSPEVKNYAQRMIDDHSALSEQIQSLASAKDVKLPEGTTSKQKSDYDKLSRTGEDFDRKFMDHNVSDHKKDIDKFSKQARSGDDPEVKALAAETVPKLQEHLKMAQAIDAKVKQR